MSVGVGYANVRAHWGLFSAFAINQPACSMHHAPQTRTRTRYSTHRHYPRTTQSALWLLRYLQRINRATVRREAATTHSPLASLRNGFPADSGLYHCEVFAVLHSLLLHFPRLHQTTVNSIVPQRLANLAVATEAVVIETTATVTGVAATTVVASTATTIAAICTTAKAGIHVRGLV